MSLPPNVQMVWMDLEKAIFRKWNILVLCCFYKWVVTGFL